MSDDKKLTPRAEDFSAWYNEVVLRAELADYSPVRGCMVIRPYGYRLWELMRDQLDRRFKETGHQNAYFPLLIPQSYLAREAEHVAGFAKEAAVVTHTRLRGTGEAGGRALEPDPESKLEEPLIIRPTSETIIYEMFSRWVHSYRDLPLLINQWANVVRWEMRTRLFLRTTEFLWQEGHTAHTTEAEAEEETLRMLGVYREFMEEWLAMPVVTGRKSESERFAGALRTYATEAMMQDNKALQAGTSHNLGQNFARQFALKFASESGADEFAWNTSWGASTRMIGGLVMTHSDDQGLVMPPRVAPIQVVIVPIYRKPEERDAVIAKARELAGALAPVRVHVDLRENFTAGAKFYEWELKGVPFRMEIGPKDLAKAQVVVVRRVVSEGQDRKQFLTEGDAIASMAGRLDEFQNFLLDRARQRREASSYRGVSDYARFREIIDGDGGFVYTGWCGSAECETQVKDETKATIRVLPDAEFQSPEAPTRCIRCERPATVEAMWAKSY